MTQSEFAHIVNSLDGLSPEQMERLRNELESKLAAAKQSAAADHEPVETMHETADERDDAGDHDMKRPHPEEELSDQELQRRLLNAGIVGEIKPPITDLGPYRNRKAVPIQGEPLSETVIRERR
jgi:hypothetical protein